MAHALTSSTYDSAADLALAHGMADVAAAIASRYFRKSGLESSLKSDGSPVTQADRAVEAALRDRLQRDRPSDGFVGEESGGQEHSHRRWYIDPIDGTASFLNGRPHWRTLIALTVADTVVIGLVGAPMLNQRWWATHGGGAWNLTYSCPPCSFASQPTPLAVTRTPRLAQAAVAIWPPADNLTEPTRLAAARLAASSIPPPAQPHPASGILHGALLVATGQLDAFLFAGAGPWDLAAMIPIVEEAGGRFTDVAGGRSLRTPAAVFSNGLLHNQIMRCIRGDHCHVASIS